jgi:hypothetical protein
MAEKKKSRETALTGPKKASILAFEASELEGVALPIEMRIPDELEGHYSNHATIQFSVHECTISFFQIASPVLMGSAEDMKEQAKGIASVKANCVSRIVMAKSFAQVFLSTFQELYAKQAGAAENRGE